MTFELGNEPELYSNFPYLPRTSAVRPCTGRPKSYSFADITSQWDQLADALPHVRLAGPGYAGLNALPYVHSSWRDQPDLSCSRSTHTRSNPRDATAA